DTTKTRFKSNSPHSHQEYEFYKKDAREYGQQTGYGRSYRELFPMNDETKANIEETRQDIRFGNLMYRLDEHESRDQYRKLDNFDKRKVVEVLSTAVNLLMPEEKKD